MKKIIDKRIGITLVALVITIVIILLLAVVTIQITIGDNGLIGKASGAKKKQAKTELEETMKIEYLNLKSKSLESSDEINIEKVFEESAFLDKYSISGENIIDKKGNIIAKKEEIVNNLKNINTNSGNDEGKIVGGVKILKEDYEKLIVKLKVSNKKTSILFGNEDNEDWKPISPIDVDFGNRRKRKNL